MSLTKPNKRYQCYLDQELIVSFSISRWMTKRNEVILLINPKEIDGPKYKAIFIDTINQLGIEILRLRRRQENWRHLYEHVIL